MARLKDLTGQRFGRLTVVARAPNGVRVRWLCRCDCGAEKAVQGCHLTSGGVVSCGCLRVERVTELGKKTKHGGGRSPEYVAWCNMRYRCLVPTTRGYHDYGGRGIKVCDRWLESFANFREDMGPRPRHHSLDRIDNEGDYTPENCRWASKSQQARNTRVARWETIDGTTRLLADWIADSGLDRTTVYKRLSRGMTLKSALTR